MRKVDIQNPKLVDHVITEVKKRLNDGATVEGIDEEGEIYIKDAKSGIDGYFIWSDLVLANNINMKKVMVTKPVMEGVFPGDEEEDDDEDGYMAL